ncbi:hypothetical protein FRC09_012496 [Ceratobasidium sp. 395]|nr:hypothetical protein FRC09_012496 [Ceratobasidium sp. 395]
MNISPLEGVGFEIKAVDVLGVHYSASIWRWYKNWISNKSKVIAAYGKRWFRIWALETGEGDPIAGGGREQEVRVEPGYPLGSPGPGAPPHHNVRPRT